MSNKNTVTTTATTTAAATAKAILKELPRKEADKPSTIYIAYGSNMSLPRMYKRCPHAVPLGTGFINDYRLVFRKSKTGFYTSIDAANGKKVPVVLWLINTEDEIKLDIAEGCPTCYRKYSMKVDMVDPLTGAKKPVEGIVYILPEKNEPNECSAKYFNLLAEAFNRFGFDYALLSEALDYTSTKRKSWLKANPKRSQTQLPLYPEYYSGYGSYTGYGNGTSKSTTKTSRPKYLEGIDDEEIDAAMLRNIGKFADADVTADPFDKTGNAKKRA